MEGEYGAEQPVDASYLTRSAAVAVSEPLTDIQTRCVPLPQFINLPRLPLDSAMNPEAYLGPTEESNWVMPGRVLVGAYPSSLDDDLNAEILLSILRLGVTTFVCLQQEYEHHGVTEYMWRNGFKLRPYIYDAVQLLDHVEDWPSGDKPEGLEFVHFPIVDCATVSDARVLRLCKDLVKRLTKKENLYIHCWGGHGRTGTVISVMLGLMYNLPPEEAMEFCQRCHDLRACPMGVPSPQTDDQRAQVVRILNGVLARRKRHADIKARNEAAKTRQARTASRTEATSTRRLSSRNGRPSLTPRSTSPSRQTRRGSVQYGPDGHRIPSSSAAAASKTGSKTARASIGGNGAGGGAAGSSSSSASTARRSSRPPHTARDRRRSSVDKKALSSSRSPVTVTPAPPSAASKRGPGRPRGRGHALLVAGSSAPRTSPVVSPPLSPAPPSPSPPAPATSQAIAASTAASSAGAKWASSRRPSARGGKAPGVDTSKASSSPVPLAHGGSLTPAARKKKKKMPLPRGHSIGGRTARKQGGLAASGGGARAARSLVASSKGGRSIRPPVGPSMNVAGTLDAKPSGEVGVGGGMAAPSPATAPLGPGFKRVQRRGGGYSDAGAHSSTTPAPVATSDASRRVSSTHGRPSVSMLLSQKAAAGAAGAAAAASPSSSPPVPGRKSSPPSASSTTSSNTTGASTCSPESADRSSTDASVASSVAVAETARSRRPGVPKRPSPPAAFVPASSNAAPRSSLKPHRPQSGSHHRAGRGRTRRPVRM